jgi:hypothetical protein
VPHGGVAVIGSENVRATLAASNFSQQLAELLGALAIGMQAQTDTHAWASVDP